MLANSTSSRTATPVGTVIVLPAEVAARASVFGLRQANAAEIAAGVALGERLTGLALATPEVVSAVHEVTGMSAWITGDPVDGVYLLVPLSPAGLLAVREDTFEPGAPDRAHFAAAGELCAGIYVGVYAGATREARRAIMHSSAILRVELFGAVPCFARAATDDGARSMVSLGFEPLAGNSKKLWVQEALVPATIIADA